jgi:hypothetical protein
LRTRRRLDERLCRGALAKLGNISALRQLDLDWIEPSGGQIVFGQLGPEPARGIAHHRFDTRVERIGAPANFDAKRVLLDVLDPA